ncbi:ABC transporter substrate-binding protein [uncultured Polaribacter sp.]|uniref:ABC transporter substrate-binding protein n=1 Tax=uncultured Polaribacter sp. TaxID=174711 RepID=UPI00261BB0F9|nr:ABC transporter substrate-binding protein [uncultured Polaribacter sp.]
MRKNFSKIIFICFLILFYNCKKKGENIDNINTIKSKIKYAQGFGIVYENGEKKLIIKTAFKNDKTVKKYVISKNNGQSNTEKIIKTPVKKIIATSTTHIPMIELLNEETAIIGFPNSEYISSERTRKLITEGKIKEIGKENSLNTEIILDLQPELVVGYSVSNADKSLTTLQKANINVIYNGDWLEETPLGRAEWIKFFGVLFDKEKEADSIFKVIERNYLDAKQIATSAKLKPTVLSGAIMSKDIWNLPAGESFVAQFLKDANLNYLWKDSKGKGSLSLSFESVFDIGKSADYWIAPGYFSSKEQLLKSNILYKKFNAFKQNKIFTPTIKKGKTGGIIYYELAGTRPDLVLKDLIKICNPDLLPDYKLAFFEKML